MKPPVAQNNIMALRRQFNRERKLKLDFPGGKSLWIVDVTEQCSGPTVLVAYEGGGVIRFEFDRPLNLFRLYSAGFAGGVAIRVLDALTDLFPPKA